jgi:hypothetical protein
MSRTGKLFALTRPKRALLTVFTGTSTRSGFPETWAESSLAPPLGHAPTEARLVGDAPSRITFTRSVAIDVSALAGTFTSSVVSPEAVRVVGAPAIDIAVSPS